MNTNIIFRDLSKEQERRYNPLEALLEILVQNVPLGITLVSAPDLTVQLVSPFAQSISPFELELGMPIYAHAPPELAERMRTEYLHVIETGETFRATDKLIPRRPSDGAVEAAYYTFMRTRVLLPSGKPGVLIIGQETTPQVKMRHELEKRVAGKTTDLRKAYDFANAVIENVPDMIFVKEAKDLKFVRFNRAGEELLGYPRDSLIGKNDYDFFPKSEADFFITKDRAVIAGGVPIDIPEEPIHTRFKGKRLLYTRKVPIYDEKGRPEYLLGISEDITEKKQTEEYRQRMLKERFTKEEAQKDVHLRDEFISIAAHELKTPLTALKMQIQLLSKILPEIESPKTKAVLGLMENSQEQLDRFTKLVDDLLDVSRASAGRLILDRVEEDLSEIVHRVAKRYEAEMKKVNCALALHLERSVIGVWDPLRIEQVLVNLLSNAMKYGAGQPIEITTRKKESVAELTVQDHGIGIAPEDQGRVFDRFERAVSAKTFGGLGLGLYITRQIVDAHEGKIRVESEKGKGSSFIVELPLHFPQPA